MALVKHYGSLIHGERGTPLENFTVRFEPSDRTKAAPIFAVTDKNGAFELIEINDDETWRLSASDMRGETAFEAPVDLKKGDNASKRSVYLLTLKSEVTSQWWGRLCLSFLIIVLLASVTTWVLSPRHSPLHQSTALLNAGASLQNLTQQDGIHLGADEVGKELSAYVKVLPDLNSPPDLAEKITTARAELTAMSLLRKSPADQIRGALDELRKFVDVRLAKDWIKTVDAAKANLSDLDKLKQNLKSIADASQAVPSAQGYIAVIDQALLADGKRQADRLNDDKTLFLNKLNNTQLLTNEIAMLELRQAQSKFVSFDWIVGRNMTLTVLFWAFVGIVVRLIMVIQGYLRFGRFYRRGLYQHVALLVAVPILVSGFIKLASLVTIQMSSSDLQLDFGNHQIMAVAAFLLALSPWGIWSRLLNLSRSVSGGSQPGDQ